MRFVLSSSGHIAALVNPPGNPKASYRVGTTDERDPDQWASAAENAPRFVVAGLLSVARRAWRRSEDGAHQKLGTRGLAPLEPAPGSYVHER